MADKDLDSSDGPSLEMPSLGSLFRRKKKNDAEPEPAADETPPSREDEEGPAADDGESGTATPTVADDDAPATDDATPGTDDAAAVAEPADDDPTTILDEPPVAESESLPLFADEVEEDADAEPTVVVPPVEAEVDDPETEDEADDAESDDEEAAKGSGFKLPPVAGRIAAIITGAIVGFLAVGLTYAGLRGCEAARGTSTCGGAGLPLMVAILVVLVVVGSALLGAWKVTDPGSTSFLAIGLLAVVALLFLIEVIFSPWMVLVIPVVAIGTFALSQWVTEKFIEDAEV